MKKALPFIAAVAAGALLTAQPGEGDRPLSGTVIYRQTDQLNIQLEGDAAQFAHALPKERTSEKILMFSEEATLYQNHQSEQPPESMHTEGGGTVMIRMVEPDNKVFTDLANGSQIEQKEFMSRVFLIEKGTGGLKWKMTGNQKLILGYPCQEAVAEQEPEDTGSDSNDDGDGLIHAWFTPRIAVPAGPSIYGGLPGLVLAVDINGGGQVIEAVSVDLEPVDPGLLKKPRKGKKVNEEEYQAIVEEKMEEMGAEQGGGGNHTFTVRIQQ